MIMNFILASGSHDAASDPIARPVDVALRRTGNQRRAEQQRTQSDIRIDAPQ
jgi:hypothetical protein